MWEEAAPARSLTAVAQELARVQGCLTPLEQPPLRSEWAVGLSSHLEKFKTVCLGEGGPRGGGSKAWPNLSQAQILLGRGEGWARPGQMGFPRIGVLEGRRKTGWAGGMSRGNASGALEWSPWGMVLQFSVQMFLPPSPCTELRPSGQIAERHLFSRSVVADSLRPRGLQHARLPCPSPSPGACSNSCPLSRGCHPTVPSSMVPWER